MFLAQISGYFSLESIKFVVKFRN